LTGRSARTASLPLQGLPPGWTASLDRLDCVLAQRDGLRLRIVCPSQEFAAEEMSFGVGRWLSCSRGVWESLTLGTERDRAVVMLQAPSLGDGVLDYLFGLLSGQPENGRTRHAIIEIDDERNVHLSEKILSRAPLLARLRSTVEAAREHGHVVEGLSCYASSPRMATLAHELGTELMDADPTLLIWGTKAGSRQVFRATGTPHPAGSYRPDATAAAVAETLGDLASRFGHGMWMIKADHGFGSGHGNAIIDTGSSPAPIAAGALARGLRPCAGQIPAEDYVKRIAITGAVIERVITGQPGSSLSYPSALAYLRRGGDGRVNVHFLGVHDQIVGRSGDYAGCRFPADSSYRAAVTREARKVFAHLAGIGVTGHAGVDFVAIAPASAGGDPARIYATEINLRQTGSTHPHRTVRAVLQGTWEADGSLVDRGGREIFYKGTDGIISARYVGICTTLLLDRLHKSPRLTFDSRTRRGAIPHLWSSLERCGKIGATFIGSSAAECDMLEAEFIALLDDIAAGSATSPGLP
jgi:hypothetical protein